MKPIVVTYWYGPYRLLDQSLRRNRGVTPGLEWWLVYGHYPLLGSEDGVSDVRKAQNLCRELNIQWFSTDEKTKRDALVSWALNVGRSWNMHDQQIFVVPDDAALMMSWSDGMGLSVGMSGKSLIRSTVRYGSDVQGMLMREMCSDVSMANFGHIVPGFTNTGGRKSHGGEWDDGLYDPQYIEWQESLSPLSFSDWIEKKSKTPV